jgi:hypothetical protein
MVRRPPTTVTLGYTMAKEPALSRHRQQMVTDAVERAIRDALPIGYTGQFILKVSIEDRRVKVEVEHSPED